MIYVAAFRNYVIKFEEIYLKFSGGDEKPSDLGRQQFFEFESFGKYPEQPDPYFLRLSRGKKWMDWQRNELRRSWKKSMGLLKDGEEKPSTDWSGWYQLRQDWLGELDILKLLFNWHKDIPDWVLRE